MTGAVIRIAHLSDVHLGPLPAVPLRLLNLKRASGLMTWLYKRRYLHRPEIAGRLAADIAALDTDHVVVTGDLINIGLPSEVARAADWLLQLGPPSRVSVVPGNHDIYSDLGGRKLGAAALEPWAAHFTSSPEAIDFADAAHGTELGARPGPFPFLRLLRREKQRVALIGLNSAVETPPLMATGTLGWRQLQRLDLLLEATGAAGWTRVILIHHPPLTGVTSAHHELRDAAGLMDVVRRQGAELILHGHNHRRMINHIDGSHGRTICVGVPSASAARARVGEQLARAHLFEFGGGRGGITMIARGLTEPGGAVQEIERVTLGA